jgi:hypothetical protein
MERDFVLKFLGDDHVDGECPPPGLRREGVVLALVERK